VKTARRYRTIQIQAGAHTITAADPLPDDLHDALQAINRANGHARWDCATDGVSGPTRRAEVRRDGHCE
jgi:hypothetical protein